MAMNRADRIVADLMTALDAILREAEKAGANRHFIAGMAEQAMRTCDHQRERNSDGYLIVKVDR
jgi:hypothetical protein